VVISEREALLEFLPLAIILFFFFLFFPCFLRLGKGLLVFPPAAEACLLASSTRVR
jgi:hypothetical protein